MCFTSQSIKPVSFHTSYHWAPFSCTVFRSRQSIAPLIGGHSHVRTHTHSETPIPSDLLPRIRRVSAVSSDDDDDRPSFVLSSFTVLLHYASSADTGSLCGRKSIALPRLLLLLDFSSCAAASTFYLLLHTLTLSLLFLSFAHSRVIPVSRSPGQSDRKPSTSSRHFHADCVSSSPLWHCTARVVTTLLRSPPPLKWPKYNPAGTSSCTTSGSISVSDIPWTFGPPTRTGEIDLSQRLLRWHFVPSPSFQPKTGSAHTTLHHFWGHFGSATNCCQLHRLRL